MPVDEQVANAYDFSVFGTLVAPGGDHAGFLVTALKRNPALKGILFDRREGIAQARKQVEAQHQPLFEAAGLRLTRVVPTESTYTILEAIAL